MSRTYRLRKDPAISKAIKWVDSPCTTYKAVVEEEETYQLAHMIYNVPCVIEGQAIVEVVRESWGWEDTRIVSHKKCMEEYYGRKNIRWGYYRSGDGELGKLRRKPMAVLNMSWHPYARPNRKRHSHSRIYAKGSGRAMRRKSNMQVAQAARLYDLDSFEDTRSIPGHIEYL